MDMRVIKLNRSESVSGKPRTREILVVVANVETFVDVEDQASTGNTQLYMSSGHVFPVEESLDMIHHKL